MNVFPVFPRKWFQLCHSKIFIKLKNALFKHSQKLFLSSRSLQNHFLRSFLQPNFDLITLERFLSLYRKIVSTSSLKNLQKTKKCSFQMLRTLAFELKVASKQISKKLLWPNFDLNSFQCFASLSQQMVPTSSIKN